MNFNDNYLNLITSEHRARPKYIETVEKDLDDLEAKWQDSILIALAYDVENSTGIQLDRIGERIGASRIVPVNDGTGLSYNLTDDDYKIYIKSNIVMNRWDGGIESLQGAWKEILGSRIVIQDNQDMTIDVYLVGNFSKAIIDLIKAHKIVPKPMGVRINIYYFAQGRLFSYGYNNALLTGYGGWWRTFGDEPDFTYDLTENTDTKAGYDAGYWG